MKKFFSTIIILALLGAAGYYGYNYYIQNMVPKTTPEIVQTTDIPTTTNAQTAPVQTVPTETTTDITPSDTPKGIADGGVYLPYTSTAMAQAKGQVILFFWANWSPTCNATDKDITTNIAKIPLDVTILKVNYDDTEELKKLYDVTLQQTFVQVDNTGKMIKKWRGANTLEEVLAQVQR